MGGCLSTGGIQDPPRILNVFNGLTLYIRALVHQDNCELRVMGLGLIS